MTGPRFEPVAKLTVDHDVEAFSCGQAALDSFLKKYALVNQLANSAQTYVACASGSSSVVGFYSLTVGSVTLAEAPPRVSKGLPRHPVPVMVLARLAVDETMQGVGLGRALLVDALRRTAHAAEIAGIRAMLVHAKDDAARTWYEKFDFERSVTDPYHLFLLMKDIKNIVVTG